jgi:signal transduction histidine kinase
MIAAAARRPDQLKEQQRTDLSTLNFLMLLVWWMFLYAFIVFPHQYVVLNVAAYNHRYDVLYEAEGVALAGLLAYGAWTSAGAWRRLYLNLCAASAMYAVTAPFLARAVVRGTYYSGSFYDIPLMGTIAWVAATGMTARQWQLQPAPPRIGYRQGAIAQRAAMLAMLSLPLLGLWTFRWDHSPALSRTFRLFAVLIAMLVLGGFIYLRQHLQNQALIGLLEKSRRSFENEQRLQSHLVQREKLASLGHLVAGAAHEINHPLAAILTDSEKLWARERLSSEQDSFVRKLVGQAQRTRDLVSSLLSFAQQSSAEKTMVDLSVLLPRSVQMLALQRHNSRIRVETLVEPNLPPVWGNGNQLFHAAVQIVANAFDAMQGMSGGSLRISAQRQEREVVLQFADSGPGIREPHRVFDPFYTTKPTGKGTGLGLSAVYGVVQDHEGQITCQNRPEGGALFTVRLPVPGENAARAAGAKA